MFTLVLRVLVACIWPVLSSSVIRTFTVVSAEFCQVSNNSTAAYRSEIKYVFTGFY
jgi:hypothetical protein